MSDSNYTSVARVLQRLAEAPMIGFTTTAGTDLTRAGLAKSGLVKVGVTKT